jgi:2-methylcitrate dehydratase PrpD
MKSAPERQDVPLALSIAQSLVGLSVSDLGNEAVEKAKLCLYDLIGCAFEARDKPWSRQAAAMAVRLPAGANGSATVIGSPDASSIGDAAFANAVMGHGLVREDMHSGSISHLGVVVLPALLALAQHRPVRGSDFIAAAVAGYEVGARIGRAVMDAELARIFRPTGITGPLAAAAAGARLVGLNVAGATSALGLAANTTAGLNQWGHTGGSEMFFHVGFAARNGVSAVLLAEAGAFASPTALDGEAGLFASLRKPAAALQVELFAGAPEILSVYHKPVPACNFAQSACLAAVEIARKGRTPADRIAAITVKVPQAGASYPGCDFRGPFAHVLQAKMSIQYNVAAALMTGEVSEHNFALLQDPGLRRLLEATALEVDEGMTRVYPQRQGGAVEVQMLDGTRHASRLDDVVNASAAEVRERFRVAATSVLGAAACARIERFIEVLENAEDAGDLSRLLRGVNGGGADDGRVAPGRQPGMQTR